VSGDVEISVVVPVYGCAGCLDVLHARLVTVLSGLGVTFEIVLVDDGAPDRSWPVIERLAGADPRVRGVLLSWNFGQQLAITAGLSEARGRWAVVMDCDLQEPPEEIPRLYEKAREGCDIVYAKRIGKRLGPFRVLAARLYQRLLTALTGLSVDPGYGALSIISRQVIDEFLRFRDPDRHYVHILKWLGFRTGEISYVHQERHAGRSAYSLARLVRLALDGLLFQTTTFLKWIVYLGFFVAFLGGVLTLVVVYIRLFVGGFPGWASTVVTLFVLTGMMMTSIGVCALYIGKIFDQGKGRPLFVVQKTTAAPR